ncbi:DUF3099 domain-containing protein [Cellulomonas aerilata]|uniref:DUF3099 domain-containing protein n=1 Tax=Cellulomonas aerilata TaxID=515326 RepID=UPI0011BEC10C|nr:DUF3099 domain-containing protein [Cellulomonas aerilata]
MSKRRTGTPQVHTITSAPTPLGDDIARRARRYMFQMSLRTLCFLGAVFTWGRVPAPVSVALLVGAVVLPYVAVVLANAGRERPERPDPYVDVTPQLGAGPVPGGPARPPVNPVHRTWEDDLAQWDHGMPRWDEATQRWVPEPHDPTRGSRTQPDGPARG